MLRTYALRQMAPCGRRFELGSCRGRYAFGFRLERGKYALGVMANRRGYRLHISRCCGRNEMLWLQMQDMHGRYERGRHEPEDVI